MNVNIQQNVALYGCRTFRTFSSLPLCQFATLPVCTTNSLPLSRDVSLSSYTDSYFLRAFLINVYIKHLHSLISMFYAKYMTKKGVIVHCSKQVANWPKEQNDFSRGSELTLANWQRCETSCNLLRPIQFINRVGCCKNVHRTFY